MPDTIIIATFGLVLGVLLLIAIAVGAFDSETEKRLRRRLGRIERVGRPNDPSNIDVDLRRNRRDSGIPGLDILIKRFLPRPAELRRRLTRTGRKIAVGEYVLSSLFIALAVGFGKIYLMGGSITVAVLIGIVVGLSLPHMVINRMIARRMKAFISQFPEAIDLIVRGLKSGLPVPVSMQTVAVEIPDPVSGEFRTISERVQFGQTLDDALRDAAERVPAPEFRFFVISLAVQRETGGNLAETLENLADILRKRQQMKLKIKAMSSEAKASAMILGSLPFLVFSVVYAINPGYVTQLFTDPRGVIMVAGGLASLAIGIVVMMKMVRFEI